MSPMRTFSISSFFTFFFKLSDICTLVWSSKLIFFFLFRLQCRYGNTISKDKLTCIPYNTVLIISGTSTSPRLETSAPIQGWNMHFFRRSSNLYDVEKVDTRVGGSRVIWKSSLETFFPPSLPCSSTTKVTRGILLETEKEGVTCLFNGTPNRSEQNARQTAPPFHLQNLTIFRKCCSLNFKGITRHM